MTRHLTLPTQLPLLRLLLVPVIGYTLTASWAYHDQVSVAVYAGAAATDTLDGRIARSRGLVTELGKFLDPLADKILVIKGGTVAEEGTHDELVALGGVYSGFYTIQSGLSGDKSVRPEHLIAINQ